mgnify:CR=1 FL=1
MENKLGKTIALVAGIGAITWGTLTFFGFNVVSYLANLPVLNTIPMLSNIVYGAVGVAGVALIWNAFK